MPIFWTCPQDAVDVASRRHGARSNYIFADSHVAARDFKTIYVPASGLDLWHPAKVP